MSKGVDGSQRGDRSPNGPTVGSSRRDDRKNGASSEAALPVRKKLHHETPPWVEPDAVFFITVCAGARGSDLLCHAETPARLWISVRHRVEQRQWWPHLFLVMPDHLHGLISFAVVPGIRKTMSEWKRYSAHTLGIEWQRGFFDHRLRKEESFVEKAHYIRMNPVRAGLVAKLEDWPHVWTMDGASRHGGINSALAPLCSGERALPSNPNAIASEQKGTTTNKGRDRSPSGPPT